MKKISNETIQAFKPKKEEWLYPYSDYLEKLEKFLTENGEPAEEIMDFIRENHCYRPFPLASLKSASVGAVLNAFYIVSKSSKIREVGRNLNIKYREARL